MNLLKRHFVLIGFFIFNAYISHGTNLHTFHRSASPLIDTVKIYATSATGSKDDFVTISVKVSNFRNMSAANFSLTWSNTLLQYDSHASLFAGQTFNTTMTGTGALGVSWSVAPDNRTLPDDTEIIRIRFKIIGCSGNPADINFFFVPTPIEFYDTSFTNLRVNAQKGRVIIKPGNGCNISRQPGNICEEAPLLCPSEFPYKNALTRTTRGTFPVDAACFRASIDNNVWLAFIAGTSNIEFSFSASNCVGQGIQAAVLQTDDCVNFINFVDNFGSNIEFCQRQIDQGFDKSIVCTGLTVGKKYYIMIDGYNGALCDFEIKITSGSVLGAGTSSVVINGPSTVCINKPNNKFIALADTNNITNYTWQVPSGATIKSGQGSPSVIVDWGNTSGQICVTTEGRCGISLPLCKSVTTTPLPEGNLNVTICAGSTFTYSGQPYTTAGNYIVTLKGAAQGGCDSLVRLSLSTLDFSVSASKSGDIPCSGTPPTLTASVTNPSNATLVFEWKNPQGQVISSTATASATTDGIFTVTVKATLNGTTCTKSQTVTVGRSGSFPTKPSFSTNITTSCLSRTETFQVSNPASDVQYQWSVTGGTIATQNASVITVNWSSVGAARVCVAAENGCGKSEETCVNVAVSKTPNAVTINGDGEVCPSSKSTYSVPNDTLVSTYVWTVPSGAIIESGAGTNAIVVNWGVSTGGIVSVLPKNNSCGDAPLASKTVVVKNTPPSEMPIAGPTTLCSNDTATYLVTPNAAIIEYTWTLSSGLTALTPLNGSSVKVQLNTTTGGTLSLQVKNGCNLTRTMTLNVTVKDEKPDSVPIIGNKTVCSNDTTIFSVTPNSPVSSFVWQVPNGARILRGQNTNQIDVVWGTANSDSVRLTMSNTCNQSVTITSFISIKKAELAAPTITGNKLVCPGTVSTYSIPADPKVVSYTWSTPSNGTILSGQGTPSIEVRFAEIATSDVCLIIKNECGVTRGSCFAVEVKNSVDSLPISGPSEVCEGSIATFKIQKDPNAESYLWFPPAGSTLLPGFQGKDSVRIQIGSRAGVVTVSPSGGCADGTFSRLAFKIKNKPAAPLVINGRTSICENDTLTYSIAPVSGATSYVWTFPSGVKILRGDSTTSITVRWQSILSGLIRVRAVNECGIGDEMTRTINVRIAQKPFAGADDSICGLAYTLKGASPIGTSKWSVISKPTDGTLAFFNDSDVRSAITASKPGLYQLLLTMTNGTCSNQDTVAIDFKANPVLTLLNDDCNNVASAYRVRVNIATGSAPFTFKASVNGSVLGSVFTSEEILSGSAYWVQVRDASGCISDTLRGVKRCPCLSNAGIIEADSMVICFGDKATFPKAINVRLDGNDGAEYILHNGSVQSVGSILMRNKSGIFEFDSAKLVYNQPYYVAYGVGNILLDSTIDVRDGCTQFSKSVPVVFKEKIEIGLTGDTTICAGSIAVLKIKTTDTKSAFKIEYFNGIENITRANVTTTSGLSVTPSVKSTFKLLSATTMQGCKAVITDSAKVAIKARPFVNAGSDTTVCSNFVRLTATTSAGVNISWRSPAGLTINNPTNPTIEVSNLRNGRNNFVLTARDSTCATYVVTDTVAVFLPVSPQAANQTLRGFIGDTITSVLNEGAPVGAYDVTRLTNPKEGYFELFSNGKFNYIANMGRATTVSFRYMICSAACNTVCDTGEVRIILQARPKVDTVIVVDIPNAITPNGDTKNDTWIMNNLDKFPENELIIFNRWGDLLYRAKPYNNNWGGTNQNGEELPEGTYYYVLRLNINDGKILKGDITILR